MFEGRFQGAVLVDDGSGRVQVVDAGQRVDGVVLGREGEEQHFLHQRAGDVVGLAVLVLVPDRLADAVVDADRGELLHRLGRAALGAGDDVGALHVDAPVAFADARLLNDGGQEEAGEAEVGLQPLDAILLRLVALANPVQFLDGEADPLQLHPLLEILVVGLLAVGLVADDDMLNARHARPLAVEVAQRRPALGELHAVAHAVEQVLVAAVVDAHDHHGGAVRGG